MQDFFEDLGNGIFAIDTGYQRPRFDAAYLMVEAGRAAFIDTGTNFAVPRLLAALDAQGLEPEAVDWVIPTHVHLDHAGGVGLLMQSLPNARLLAHPRGLRHMIEPKVLYFSARAVYGEAEMLRSYGRLVPVPAERGEASHDGQRIQLAGRELLLLDTPGHARHHHCIWDAKSRGVFAGDTFGLSYREFDTARGPWITPTTTPVQFEPEPLKDSIRRLMALGPESMYLTHYGRVSDVARLGTTLIAQIDQMTTLALSLREAEDRHQRLKAGLQWLYLESLHQHGSLLSPEQQLHLLASDVELNAQGLGIWLDKMAQP